MIGSAVYCNGKVRLSSVRLRHRLAKIYGAKALRGLERKAKAQFIGAVDAMAEYENGMHSSGKVMKGMFCDGLARQFHVEYCNGIARTVRIRRGKAMNRKGKAKRCHAMAEH